MSLQDLTVDQIDRQGHDRNKFRAVLAERRRLTCREWVEGGWQSSITHCRDDISHRMSISRVPGRQWNWIESREVTEMVEHPILDGVERRETVAANNTDEMVTFRLVILSWVNTELTKSLILNSFTSTESVIKKSRSKKKTWCASVIVTSLAFSVSPNSEKTKDGKTEYRPHDDLYSCSIFITVTSLYSFFIWIKLN